MRLAGQFQTCLFFLRKDSERTETQIIPKPTNKTKTSQQKTTKATSFRAHKNFKEGENHLFCVLALFYAQNVFVKK